MFFYHLKWFFLIFWKNGLKLMATYCEIDYALFWLEVMPIFFISSYFWLWLSCHRQDRNFRINQLNTVFLFLLRSTFECLLLQISSYCAVIRKWHVPTRGGPFKMVFTSSEEIKIAKLRAVCSKQMPAYDIRYFDRVLMFENTLSSSQARYNLIKKY